ncbi:SDR family oxidoreductase [Pseudomonas borbori]
MGIEASGVTAQDAQAPKPDWSTADMPSQAGRTVLITGGTSGMGYEDALALSRAGANVIIAARNQARGDAAVSRIQQAVPGARVSFETLDLADLRSVAALSQRLQSRQQRLDVLINNAAVMALPERELSADGYELQLATNYLGHFALTAQLLPLLRKSPDPRVINLASIAVHHGRIDFNDLQAEKGYAPMPVYAQSKLAMLMFAFELQRRSDQHGWGIRSIGVHPGVAVTELVKNGPGLDSAFGQNWAKDRDVYHSAAQGALSTLYAATATQARGGAYYGPTGADEKRGPLGLATIPQPAQDAQAAARLWDLSEQLTGASFR